MKKILIATIVLILIITGVKAQTVGKSKYIKPTNYQKIVSTIISGKKRTYYSLSSEKTALVSVKGPGILLIMTRGQFSPNEKDRISYEIIYSIDGAEEKKIKITSVGRSKKATYFKGTLGVPGIRKDFEMELGRGNHSIAFRLSGNTIPVANRYKFTPTKAKKLEWIKFSPLQPSEPVDIISRESTVNYYRFSNEKPLKVEIFGPTQLRLLTRIENHFQMKGRIHYRVQVQENENILNTYQLSSRHSEIAVYKTDSDLIPGKACEFVIDVPKGEHTYTIMPLDKDKNTILGRILLPKKDVKLKK